MMHLSHFELVKKGIRDVTKIDSTLAILTICLTFEKNSVDDKTGSFQDKLTFPPIRYYCMVRAD